MKKLIASLLALTLMLSVVGALVSCGRGNKKPTEHVHVFDIQEVDDIFLKREATDESPAIYYYICECGEMSRDHTYTYGERLPNAVELLLAEIVAAPAPSSVVTTVTTVNNGVTLTSKTTLSADEKTVECRTLNKLDINNPDVPMIKTETLTAANGGNTLVLSAMNFSDTSILDGASADRGVLRATVTDPSAFFGTTVTTFSSAAITVTVRNGAVIAMTVNYTTTNGSVVTLAATLS